MEASELICCPFLFVWIWSSPHKLTGIQLTQHSCCTPAGLHKSKESGCGMSRVLESNLLQHRIPHPGIHLCSLPYPAVRQGQLDEEITQTQLGPGLPSTLLSSPVRSLAPYPCWLPDLPSALSLMPGRFGMLWTIQLLIQPAFSLSPPCQGCVCFGRCFSLFSLPPLYFLTAYGAAIQSQQGTELRLCLSSTCNMIYYVMSRLTFNQRNIVKLKRNTLMLLLLWLIYIYPCIICSIHIYIIWIWCTITSLIITIFLQPVY